MWCGRARRTLLAVLWLALALAPATTLAASVQSDFDLAAPPAHSPVIRLWLNDGTGRFREPSGPSRAQARVRGRATTRGSTSPVGEASDASVELRARTVTSYVIAAPIGRRGTTSPEQLPARLDHPLVLSGPRPPPSLL